MSHRIAEIRPQTHPVSPAKGSRRRALLALSLAALLVAPAYACGPDFPVTLLDRRGAVMESLPEGGFDFEVMHLLPKPADGLAVADADYWADSSEARSKAEAQGLSAAQVQAVAAMRAAGNVDEALGLAGDLPADVALYTAGALAWSQNDSMTAEENFRAVLALPEAERSHRGLWASYMLGRSRVQYGDAAGAAEAFEQTRALARAGAPDPLGLAVSSLGEQARAQREAGDLNAAVRLYAEQAAYGSVSGSNSLLFVMRAAIKNPSDVDTLLTNPLSVRLVLAYLYARSNELSTASDDDEYPSYDAAPDNPHVLTLLDRLGALPAEAVTAPERLAAVAYRAGRFEQAAKWAAGSSAPLAAWVRAKLALRGGDTAAAAQAYVQAIAGFPAEEWWGTVPLRDPDSYQFETIKPQCRVNAEAGTLALSRGDYLQALDLLYAAADVYWTDAAYVAERVVSVDELRSFVDRVAPKAIDVAAPAATSEDDYEEDYAPAPAANRLRALLARRLVRSGRAADAVAYFDDAELREQAQAYVAALKGTEAWGRVDQARAWFGAAGIARWHGMELMGFEGDPDYASWGGSFDLNSPITWDEDYNPIYNARQDLKVAGPYTSDGERQRLAQSVAKPLERFHYRLTAAGHAGKAADLLPPRSQAFAAVLCEGTRWLIDRQPEQAAQMYRRYLHEGPYVPWGASFGRQCPAPNFEKVEAELQAAFWAKVRRGLTYAAPVLLLAIAGFVWLRRRTRVRHHA